MYVDVIEDFGALERVRGDWDAAYALDPEASLFMSWRWIVDWLTERQTVWLVLAAKRTQADDHYVAFLPLRMRVHFDRERGFFNELYLAGSGFSDHAGVLTRPDVETAAVSAFTDYLRRKLKWAKLTMSNLWMSDRRRRLFLSAFDESRFVHKDIEYIDKITNTNVSICPFVALPSDWDTYLTGLSANNRQKIRRWLRKVDASENYEITLSDASTYASDIEALLRLWASKWSRRKGARTNDIVQYNRAMLTRCAANGNLFLPVFRHKGRPVAALAILVDPTKKAMLFFLAGRDEHYDEAPAGYLLHAFSIRHAIAQSFISYDFLRGDEPYKYLFTSQERRLRACSVSTRNGRNLGHSLDPRGLVAMRDKALELENKNEIIAAEHAHRQILTMQPNDALTLYRLGRLMAANGDHAEAARLLSLSVAAEPGGGNAWLKLALSLQALTDNVAALRACREAIRLQPTNEDAKRLVLQLTLSVQQPSTKIKLWSDPNTQSALDDQDGLTPDWMRLGPAGWEFRRTEANGEPARS
ncbi:GNAT family N-acetyltransferase [Brevundimonas sp. NPDC090276]|uniref:GNAT family N-acetyltransferase n=1 Tax=Brevundimonas sp. NPDC090276 TaxID=3363956 RepID=UPI00383B75CA